MNLRLLLFWGALGFQFFAGLAFSGVLEISVPLATPPDPWALQVVPLVFPAPVEDISRIALRLEGTYRNQWYFIMGSTPGINSRSLPGRMEITLGDEVLSAADVQIVHTFPGNQDGPIDFEVTEILWEGSSEEVAWLIDGETQLGFSDCPRLLYEVDTGQQYSPVNTFGTISGATLLVTYGENVGVPPDNWGSVKALFR